MGLMINSVMIEQTQGGYSIEHEQEWADDKAVNQYGKTIGTLLGERTYITVTTNQLSEDKAKTLREALHGRNSVYVRYYDIRQKKNVTKLFTIEGRDAYAYQNQRRAVYQPKTLTLKSVELE